MELIAPCKKYYSSYIEAIKEFSEHEVDTYQFLDASKYDIFEKIQNFKTGKIYLLIMLKQHIYGW